MQKPNKLLNVIPNRIYITEHNGEYVASEHAWAGTEPYVHQSLVMGLIHTLEYIQQLDTGDPNFRTKVTVAARAALLNAGAAGD